jgi:Family of unknown function (DUF5681)
MQTDLQDAKQVTSTKFRKGKSGNPGGRPDGERYREVFAALAAELGGEAALSASQRMLIDTIAKLQSRRGRDDVRVANAVAKLVRLLGIGKVTKPKISGGLGAILRGDRHG